VQEPVGKPERVERHKARCEGRVAARAGTGACCRRAAWFVRLHVGSTVSLCQKEKLSLAASGIK